VKTAQVTAAQASEGYAVMQDKTELSCHEQMRGLRRRLAFPTLTALAHLLAVCADRLDGCARFHRYNYGRAAPNRVIVLFSSVRNEGGSPYSHTSASMTPIKIYIDCL
jgi:hypothetical protein